MSVALARAQELGFETVACASTGNLANAVSAHAAAAGLPSYVFIPSDLEQEKVLATGAYGTNIVAIRGNYDAVNRLCTEVAGERPSWAFVNVNVRPYYAEGSKTLAFETAEQLGWELPDRVVAPIASGSLFTKVARGFQEFIDAGLLEGDVPVMCGAQADGCSPVAQAFAAGTDVCRPVKPDTIAKSLAIGNPADGPYAVELANATGGVIESVSRRRAPRRHPPARRDDGHLHRDRRRRDHRGARQARRRGRDRPRRARRRLHHRRRPEDARHGARHVRGDRDRAVAGRVRVGLRGRRGGVMAVTIKLPTQLREAAGNQTEAQVDGATVGEALDSLYSQHGELRQRIADDGGGLRRFVNVYLGGEDIRFLEGLETPVSDGDELTILPAVAGG